MSLSVSNGNIALSLLQSITQTTSIGATLVNIINGDGTSGPSGDPVASLDVAQKNETKDVALQEKNPETASDIAHFLKVAKSATSLQQLLSDPIAAKVFLTANGLAKQVGFTALAVKALSSDTSKAGNLASKLNNPAWVNTAETYQFASQGLKILQQQTTLDAITKGYAQVEWENSLEKQTPGIAAALDFLSRASHFKKVDQILGDANVRAVVTGALGIPEQIAFQPLEAQEKAVTSRLDISKLQDPQFVRSLADQYVINQQAKASSDNSSSSGLILNLTT